MKLKANILFVVLILFASLFSANKTIAQNRVLQIQVSGASLKALLDGADNGTYFKPLTLFLKFKTVNGKDFSGDFYLWDNHRNIIPAPNNFFSVYHANQPIPIPTNNYALSSLWFHNSGNFGTSINPTLPYYLLPDFNSTTKDILYEFNTQPLNKILEESKIKFSQLWKISSAKLKDLNETIDKTRVPDGSFNNPIPPKSAQ